MRSCRWLSARSFLATLVIVAAFALAPSAAFAATAKTVNMNRLYNPYSGEHFYTASTSERDTLVKVGWRSEGVGWVAPSTSSSPVYRLFNPYSALGDHHYTMSAQERDTLVKLGWSDEGVGWYSDDDRGTPLYRQFNPYADSGSHNYTMSRSENDSLVDTGWVSEGLAWFGVAEGFERAGAAVQVSMTCAGQKVNVLDADGGDWRLPFPSFANEQNTRLTFNIDVYVGSKLRRVAAGESVALAECLDGALGTSATTLVRDASGRVYSRLYVERSQNIPALFLTSADPAGHGRAWVESSADHSNSAEGSLAAVAANGSTIYSGALSQIRGRGNSTWTDAAKKSYQIKLGKKCDLLSTGNDANKAKTWVLVTDRFDQTALRNALSYKLAQNLGVKYAVDYDFVDLYYDGEYRGTYLLCEKPQVNTGRVDIADLEAESEDLNGDLSSYPTVTGRNAYGQEIRYSQGLKNPADISGGYLIEHEYEKSRYSSELAYFGVEVVDGYVQHFVVKSPDGWSREQAEYVSCLFQDVFDSCRNGGVVPNWRGSSRAGMRTDQLVDLDSFARLYWVNELMKNGDGLIFSSNYISLNKGSGAKLTFGPAWDFDLSSGNKYVYSGAEAVLYPTGWYTRESGIGLDMMRNPQVQAAVAARKSEAVQKFRQLVSGGGFDSAAARVKASHLLNAYAWGAKSETAPMLKGWLAQRLAWVEANN